MNEARRVAMKVIKKSRRLRVLVCISGVLFAAWAAAAFQAHRLRPTFCGYEEALVAECERILSRYGEDRQRWEFISATSMGREFLLFGAQLATVRLTAHYTNNSGKEHVRTGRYRFRQHKGIWVIDSVSGEDIIHRLHYAMQIKYPVRALQLRDQFISALKSWRTRTPWAPAEARAKEEKRAHPRASSGGRDSARDCPYVASSKENALNTPAGEREGASNISAVYCRTCCKQSGPQCTYAECLL